MNPIKITAAQAAALGVDLERLTWLDAFLQRMIDEKKHPFEAFRVWRKNTLIFSGDYGTQTPNGEPLRADAIYPLQSVTKPVVATCAALLQEEGRINFFEKVQDYFPEFEGENKDRVLLWHLLCHTSGMTPEAQDTYMKEIAGEYNSDTWLETFMALRPKLGLPDVEPSEDAADEAWSKLALNAPLDSMPGTEFRYCGYGYSMIKDIIERVSGKTLEQYAYEKIFEPLGMNDSHWFLPVEKRERYVIRDESCKGGAGLNSEDLIDRKSTRLNSSH